MASSIAACGRGWVGPQAKSLPRVQHCIERLRRSPNRFVVASPISLHGCVQVHCSRSWPDSMVGDYRGNNPPQADYRIEVATSLSRYVALAGAILVALLVALPAFASRNLINDLIFMFTMLALAQYWNLLAGYAGLVSVGQQAFVGLGGYLLFALTIHAGIDPLAAIVLAGLIAACLALPTALVVFRLRGAYFAIGTWVMAEVYRLVFAQFGQLGGGTGTSLPASVTNEVAGIEWVKLCSTSAPRRHATSSPTGQHWDWRPAPS